jgi:signal peptidase II
MTPTPQRGDAWRSLLVLATLAADQATKHIARTHYSHPDGSPDYFKVTEVAGQWLQFRLVYNSGAAFGMKPQGILPFLHPTLFFALFSAVAIGVLFYYYRKLSPGEGWQKAGVALILSGAFGNLIDRLMLHKVTDFIDVGLPGGARWPTFNIADSCVCVGVALILAAPLLMRKPVAASVAPGAARTGNGPAPEDPAPPPAGAGGAQGPAAP